jgi:hypothetical protein
MVGASDVGVDWLGSNETKKTAFVIAPETLAILMFWSVSDGCDQWGRLRRWKSARIEVEKAAEG